LDQETILHVIAALRSVGSPVAIHFVKGKTPMATGDKASKGSKSVVETDSITDCLLTHRSRFEK
jgi:hypothetical protein